jgi:hypothetical protein
MAQLTFIEVKGESSQRERALQLSTARSHAARISYKPAIHHSQSSTASSDQSDDNAEDESQSILPTAKHTAWQWINGTSSDPFDIIPGSNTGAAPYALEFRKLADILILQGLTKHAVIRCVAPTIASVNRCFGVANIYGRWLLEHMAKSRGLFHIIVASMKGARDGFAGLGESTDMLIHKMAAISHLRASISSPTTFIDDAMILTMLLLALLEDALGDRNAYQIHRAQVARLTQRRCKKNGAMQIEDFQAIVRQ